jgi:hypothetical protein
MDNTDKPISTRTAALKLAHAANYIQAVSGGNGWRTPALQASFNLLTAAAGTGELSVNHKPQHCARCRAIAAAGLEIYTLEVL